MDYFFSVRGRSGDGYSNRMGSTKFLMVPESDSALTRAREVSVSQWFRAVQDEVGGTEVDKGDIVLFVHGFNIDQYDMLDRHRSLKAGLAAHGFKGTVVSYDWPSNGSVLGYAADRLDARRAAEKLFDTGIAKFARLQRPDCVVNLHVVAHSMGCFLVREAFDYADDDHGTAQTNWTVSQIAMIAADVSSKNMTEGNPRVSSLYRHCTRLTAYYSPFDEILSISEIKRVGVSRRLGRVGLPSPVPDSAVDVYCGHHYRETEDQYEVDPGISHRWYFDAPRFFEDLSYTLAGKLDREVIPTRARTDRGGLALR